MTSSIVTLVIDDHAVVRDGIRRALELRTGFTVYSAASKAEAMASLASRRYSLLFVDLNLPDGNGLEIVSWVRKYSQSMAIIVLSLHDEDEFVLASMKAGASCYISKKESISVLLNFMDHALRNPRAFSAQSLAQIVHRSSQTFSLSPREIEVLTLLENGDSLKKLSAQLFISESTLKKHVASIYRKMQVENRVQAIAKARAHGLAK